MWAFWLSIGIIIGLYGPPAGAWLMTKTERRERQVKIARVNVDHLIDGALGREEQRATRKGKHAAGTR